MSDTEVGALELPKAFDLMHYWAKYPTVNMVIRAYFKIEPPVIDEDDFKKALAAPDILAGLGQAQPMPDSALEAIQWAEKMQTKLRKGVN